MTAEEFIDWAMQQPEGCRYELVGGEVFAMAPERAAHARGKFRVARRLAQAIERSGLEGEALIDGMAVRVDAQTAYEPDVLVSRFGSSSCLNQPLYELPNRSGH